jgi:hypothetical protein
MIYQLIVLFAVLCQFASTSAQQGWRAGSRVNTAFGVAIGASASEVYVVADSPAYTRGYVYYSSDRGNAASSVITETALEPFSIAVSRDGSAYCTAGSSNGGAGCFSTDSSRQNLGGLTIGSSQSIEPYLEDGFAATGTWYGRLQPGVWKNGVAVSAGQVDNGLGGKEHRFQYYDIGLDYEQGYEARYGAFPSQNTWYVTSGTWPNSKARRDALRLSQRVRVVVPTQTNANPEVRFVSAQNLLRGYVGAISKTTDGGVTWTKVFDSNGQYYFNQISCVNDNNCFAVGENGKMATVLKTTNGGAAWTPVLTLNGPNSLHAVNMLSTSEIFVSGGTVSSGANKELVGLYYRSTDGGATWAKSTFNGYGWDMDFKHGVGYAVALYKEHTDIIQWAY